jgi:type II secretory pathway component PulF
LPFLILDLFVAFNFLLFSSTLRWNVPLLGHLYQMQMRGQFLRTLGLMLETGKPLPAILDRVLDSELLPVAVHSRVSLLADDMRAGVSLADGLARRGLATGPMKGLIVSAQNAQNLPWALQELGDSLMRRSTRLTERTAAIVFPLAIFLCAILIGFVAVAIFYPLTTLIEKVHG